MKGKRLNRSVRWKASDIDYWDKLSPKERAWLEDQLQAMYGGSFPNDADLAGWDDQKRKEAYRNKNAANRDLYSAGKVAHEFKEPEPEHLGERDFSPTPGYLDSPEYKAARERFRGTLNPHADRAPSEVDPETDTAREALADLIPADKEHIDE